ncbi:amino acid permease-associated region [Granulicella mallensis MP5ACTX8]|uniref:Amino acid permease-associated region n=1 Tax=Granulicella mallensis (strain ATCC BAA-1857 / DSM 23137 / MP5ACTX8) TaxID=682795 RepID=G8NW61_GRAMM|nr:amino acid permease-associated region [Granulicella mallensis MP5ACTX8]
MSVSETVSTPQAGETRLRRNALSLSHVVATTLAGIAPAMSFFFGFAVIVQGAGLAAPLTILTAMVAILFLTNTIAEFSRFTPSAGSFVTFTGKAFGPSVGAAVSVFVIFGYIVAASTIVAIAGVWISETLRIFLGLSVNWALLMVLLAAGTGWLVMRGVGLSTRWSGVFFYFEAGLLVLGSILMLTAHPHFLTLAPFKFSSLTGGLTGLGVGFPLAIYLFIGWENSATLAEETENPRQNIPRALITGTLTIGIFYIFLAYATAAGFKMDAHALGASRLPFIDGLKASAPALLAVAYLAGVTSILGSLIGLVNSQARILFNSGREGLLPEFLGKIHPRHQTPHSAMWVFLFIAVALILGFCLLGGIAPMDYFGFAGTLGTVPIILTYMLTNLALPVYVVRYQRHELNIVRHVVMPIAGTLVMFFPLWGFVQPGQSWPFNVLPWVVLVVLVLSVLYGTVIARLSPGLARRIGAYVADQ